MLEQVYGSNCTEVDLDEIYYYRIRDPRGFALQTLYKPEPSSDLTLKVSDGDAVPVREGYHPVMAGPGYDGYYRIFWLVLLAPWPLRKIPIISAFGLLGKQPDPRLPLVRG
jgi:5-deoxy-glucuronate isomerase